MRSRQSASRRLFIYALKPLQEERIHIVRSILCVLIAAAALALLACATTGPYAFTDVDVNADLSPQTVSRYEYEWKAIEGAGQAECCMAELELSNSWPLGLFLYWHRNTAMRSPSPNGPIYTVAKASGYGPLCLFFCSDEEGTFDAQGKRLGGMSSMTPLMGHFGMLHFTDSALINGHHQKMTMAHAMHHIVNFHKMDDHIQVSFLSGPNPMEINSHTDAVDEEPADSDLATSGSAF
jgi:predicted small lipoprotein YifL